LNDNSSRSAGQPSSANQSRTVVDREGVTWTATEAYEFVPTWATAQADIVAGNKFCLVWFENASGRTASIYLPAGALQSVAEDDLLAFLRVATGRKGAQPG
jgi:hypothetical protein